MAATVPQIKLNNGKTMPALGLGTSQFKLQPGEAAPSPTTEGTREAVEIALEIGYRSIDTALVYRNEKEIGAGIKAKITDGTVKREELFVTTKLWSCYNNPSRVIQGLRRSLTNLQLDYVDLFLIHSPASYEFIDEETWNPYDSSGKLLYDKVDHADTWKEMEKAVDMGLARSIGVSNFNIKQIQHILDNCRIPPANIQVEGHAYLMQPKLFKFCRQHQMSYTTFAPLGSPTRWTKKAGDLVLLEEPGLAEIAAKYNKTPTQILIRFLIERGRVPIPRSTSRKHLQENFDVFAFHLDQQDLTQLDGLDKKGRIRYFPFNHIKDSPDFPTWDD